MHYLVRHGDAGDKHAWTGPDEDRPLSSTGHREAEGLIALLADRPITRIVSSPAVRCRQTVAPLAQQRRLAVQSHAALAVDAKVDDALVLVLDDRAKDVVLCTHGELIRPLLERLRGLGAPIGDEATWPKGSVWQLVSTGGMVTEAKYLAPHQNDDGADDSG